jgi:hypothetical protein
MEAFIEPLCYSVYRHFKHSADAKKSGQGNGSSCFNLLPMPRGEAERNHVFLAEALLLPQRLNTLAKPSEELGVLVVHPSLLPEHEQKHHEQISWYTRRGLLGCTYRAHYDTRFAGLRFSPVGAGEPHAASGNRISPS